jgi:hypothetical protein
MTPTADSLQGFRNRIINGDMRIDQRNAGASVSVTTSTSGYFLDRWFYYNGTGVGNFTLQQSTTAPVGFVNSILFTVTATDSSLGSGDYYLISQKIEGNNISDLAWGTANAKTVTLSFWVRSSVTGTFGGVLRNGGNTRFYSFSYSISAANTWEQKSITIVGDTTGTWLTNNGIGLEVIFSLGTVLVQAAGSWTSTASLGATGETNLMATNGATWYITGVQLEVGSVATPFERRPYGTELMLCQRYYQKPGNAIWRGNNSSATGNFYYWMPFGTTMRAAPTMGVGTPTYSNASSATFYNASAAGAEFSFNVSSGGGYVFVTWTADIEL